MPTTTQLASLVVSAFDTFLIEDNSCLSAELFNAGPEQSMKIDDRKINRSID